LDSEDTERLRESFSAIQINKYTLNKELGARRDCWYFDRGAQYGCAECAGEIYISELATISAMHPKRKINIAHLTTGHEMKEGTD
jgi:hypothetical protein